MSTPAGVHHLCPEDHWTTANEIKTRCPHGDCGKPLRRVRADGKRWTETDDSKERP